MRCLFCDKPIETYSLQSIFLKEDCLCMECRNKLRPKRKIIYRQGLEIETFFLYDGLFKSLLIQYKECYDEALSEVFLYDLKEYIETRYFGYHLCLIPSSDKKLQERGFHHLELMCKELRMPRISLKMIHQLCQEDQPYLKRKEMMNNYFYEGKQPKKILVLDDVVTTGSSLAGAKNALLGKCEKIKYLSLSYVKK